VFHAPFEYDATTNCRRRCDGFLGDETSCGDTAFAEDFAKAILPRQTCWIRSKIKRGVRKRKRSGRVNGVGSETVEHDVGRWLERRIIPR